MEELSDRTDILVFYDDGDNTQSRKFNINPKEPINDRIIFMFRYFRISSSTRIRVFACTQPSDTSCKTMIFDSMYPELGDLSWEQVHVKGKIVIRVYEREEKVGKRLTRVNSISGFNFFCAFQRSEDYVAPPGIPVLPINRILLVGEFHENLTNLNDCSLRIDEPTEGLASDKFLKDIMVNIPEDQCLDIFLEQYLPDTVSQRSQMSLINRSRDSPMTKFGTEVLPYIHDPNLRIHYVDYARHLAYTGLLFKTRCNKIHARLAEFLLFLTNKDEEYPLYLGNEERWKAFLLDYRDMFLKEMDKCYLSKDDIISTFTYVYTLFSDTNDKDMVIFLDMYTFVRLFKKVNPRGPDQIYYVWSKKNYNVRQNLVFKGSMDEVEDFLKDDYVELPDGTYRPKMEGDDDILWLSKAPNKCNSDQIRNAILYTGAIHTGYLVNMIEFINSRYEYPFEISRYTENQELLCVENLFNYAFWANKNTVIFPYGDDFHDPQSVKNNPKALLYDIENIKASMRPDIIPGPIYRVPDEERGRKAVREGGFMPGASSYLNPSPPQEPEPSPPQEPESSPPPELSTMPQVVEIHKPLRENPIEIPSSRCVPGSSCAISGGRARKNTTRRKKHPKKKTRKGKRKNTKKTKKKHFYGLRFR